MFLLPVPFRRVSRLCRLLILTALCLLLSSPLHSVRADELDPVAIGKALSRSFEQVATTITPSIVSVSTISRPKGGPLGGKLPSDPFWEQFKDMLPEDQFPQQGLGTGVIVDERGYILTNNHVLGSADDVRVRAHDGSSFTAEVVGRDPRTDIAVIKIKAKELAPAKLGDSDNLKIGEWVIAAGNPFGLENSITSGIVSAKGRAFMGGNQYEDFIQTDAAINPGNSGGPLVNLDGEVVGINTAIFSRSGGYMGIGFAIPINMARAVMESLIKDGKVVRGWLGVGIQNLSEDLAESFNYPGTEGALVGHIQEDGPAAKVLRQGDIILSFDGKKIRDVNELRNMVAATRPGSSVELVLIRDGRRTEVQLKLGELPSTVESPEVEEGRDNQIEKLGLSIETLTPDVARRLRTSRRSGVVVMQVEPGSPAAIAGLQQQDIILQIDRQEVRSVEDFRKFASPPALAKGIRMVVETQGMERFVLIKLTN